jgi:hypothetical protein
MEQAEKLSERIDEALKYAKTLLGIPYRWCKDQDVELIATHDDKFWAAHLYPVDAAFIKDHDLSIVCTGLINLIRRHFGLSIPGRGSNLHSSKTKYPGTTKKWFHYLEKQGALEPFDPQKCYPVGTLLLAPFRSNKEDQGHVAILVDQSLNGTVLQALILHATPKIGYHKSLLMKDHGSTLIEPLKISHFEWFPDRVDEKGHGYYTHTCQARHWLF